MILAILIFVTEVITRYWIKQLTRVSVQIHFFRRRQKVIGHFIFSSKIPRRDQNPDSKSDGSSDRFMDRSTTSGQFTRTESFPSPIIELVFTRDRIRDSWSSLTLIG